MCQISESFKIFNEFNIVRYSFIIISWLLLDLKKGSRWLHQTTACLGVLDLNLFRWIVWHRLLVAFYFCLTLGLEGPLKYLWKKFQVIWSQKIEELLPGMSGSCDLGIPVGREQKTGRSSPSVITSARMLHDGSRLVKDPQDCVKVGDFSSRNLMTSGSSSWLANKVPRRMVNVPRLKKEPRRLLLRPHVELGTLGVARSTRLIKFYKWPPLTTLNYGY